MKKLLFGLLIVGSFSFSTFAQTINQGQGDEILGTIMKENKCNDNASRSLTTTIIKGLDVHKDATHFGVTPQGDIAIITNDNGKAVLELLICDRPNLNGSGSISNKFELNPSPECLVSEITAGNVTLGGHNRLSYLLNFAPIDIPGTDRTSSLCQRNKKEASLDGERSTDITLPLFETLDGSEQRVIKE